MVIYVLRLEWYNEETDTLEKDTRHYFFQSADKAINFGHKIAYGAEGWYNAGCPNSVYLFKVNTLSDIAECANDISAEQFDDPNYVYEDGSTYLCSWMNCDKYLHIQ